jgi:ABC-2 type transport system ATP-binding protein
MVVTMERTSLINERQVVGSVILTAVNLSKSYNGTTALRNFSFTLRAGRVLGFLGPNGAGKTTVIRILTTILEPTAGEFYVDGTSSTHPEQIRRKIGVLPESLGFPKQMTGFEYLTYFGQHYGLSALEAHKNADTLLAEVGLSEKANVLIGAYSRGMRQRLGIARALVNDPVIVFLDEPTLGLDPRGKQELLSLVRRIAEERHAGVILCSHLLTEVEEVCNDVVILRLGQVVAAGTVAEVLENAQRDVTRVRVPFDMVVKAQQVLLGVPLVTAVTPTNGKAEWLEIEIDATAGVDRDYQNELLTALIRANIPVLCFDTEGSRLQDVFFQLTEQQEVIA